MVVNKIQQKIGNQEFEKVALLLEKENDEKQKLYYNFGLCTLKEFVYMRLVHKIFFEDHIEDLLTIANRIIDTIIFLYEKGVF